MAKLLQCDTCAAISPNPKTGLHDSNHWHEVEVRTEYGPHKTYAPVRYLICTDCMSKGVRLSHEGIAQEKQS